MTIGFTYYDTPPVYTPPTTAELLDELTSAQESAILDGFALRKDPNTLKREIFVDVSVINHMYGVIDSAEEFSRSLCRGEIIDTPAVYDEFGEIVTPATYVPAPTTLAELKTAVYNEFSPQGVNQNQSDATVDKNMAYSKWDGTGDWAYYIVEVVK